MSETERETSGAEGERTDRVPERPGARNAPAVATDAADLAAAEGAFSRPRTPPARNEKRGVEQRASAATAPPELPGAGTPEGERLREAAVAFEVGDYARVRALAADLKRAADPAVADAAADLARRVSVDPLQIAFLVLCALALCVIAWIYVFS